MERILNIQTEEIQKDGKDTYYNHRYEPTPYNVLEQFFDEYPLKKQDYFVDYGCGPGRLLFYVHHRFHCEVAGIEYNEIYYKKCVDNIDSYKGNHKEKIHVFHCGAQDYLVDDRQSVFYFFNPFSIEIFMHTLAQIQDSLSRAPRKITLIMYYPDVEYIYYLENCTEFVLTHTIPASAGSSKDVRENFLIWETGADAK